MDLKKLNNLRKVRWPDKLTKESIGKVWYAKAGGGPPEFFTDSGMHPVDTVKRLRPLSTYMLNKYISNERYLLNLLGWCGALIIVVPLLVIAILYFNKNTPRQTPATTI
ncbi:MAG: hypothetical protein EOO89_29150 [Pedobacter sp.]|nr:MAG: hypothetical protein EOO89_29150 [Pedobacter sp.]